MADSLSVPIFKYYFIDFRSSVFRQDLNPIMAISDYMMMIGYWMKHIR